MRKLINFSFERSLRADGECEPQRKIAFLKTHKCASTSIQVWHCNINIKLVNVIPKHEYNNIIILVNILPKHECNNTEYNIIIIHSMKY